MRGTPLACTVTVLAAVGALLTGCGGETAGPETGVSVGDIWADTEALAGQEVTISSEVQRFLSDRGTYSTVRRAHPTRPRLLTVS